MSDGRNAAQFEPITVRLNASLLIKLRQLALQSPDLSFDGFVAQILEAYVADRWPSGKPRERE